MRLFITLTFLYFHFNLTAQITQPARYEVELGSLNESFFSASAEENGLFIYKQNLVKSNAEQDIWDFIWLDTALNERFIKELPVAKNFNFKGSVYSNNQLILLFQSGIEYTENMLFITYEINDDQFKAYNYSIVEPMVISQFEKKDDAVIFGGTSKNKTTVGLFNFTVKKGIILPGFFNDRSDLIQINVNPNNEFIKIIASEQDDDKSFNVVIRSFSTYGNLMKTESIDQKQVDLTAAYIPEEGSNTSFIMGTFSQRKPLSKSTGLFYSNITSEEEPLIHNYTNLDHFFKFMGKDREAAIQEKIEKQLQKNKEFKFDYRVIIRDIINQNGYNILLAEGYELNTDRQGGGNDGYSNIGNDGKRVQQIGVGITGGTTTNFIAYGLNSNYRFDPLLPYIHAKGIEGFDYTHALIACFDDAGKLLWDNSIEITNLFNKQLKQFVFPVISENQQTLLYLNNQQLHVEIIKDDETIKKKFQEPLKLKKETDVLNNSIYYFEGLKKWQDNTFYAYGVNSISNTKLSVENERIVFFVNKIIVE